MVRSLDHKIPLAACNEDLKCSFVTVFSQYCLRSIPESLNDLWPNVIVRQSVELQCWKQRNDDFVKWWHYDIMTWWHDNIMTVNWPYYILISSILLEIRLGENARLIRAVVKLSACIDRESLLSNIQTL